MPAQKTSSQARPPAKKSDGPVSKTPPNAKMSWEPTAPKVKPRFGFFSLFFRTIVAIAILAGAAFVAQGMIASRPEPVERKAFERSFTVSVVSAQLGEYTPNISAFGEINAAQTLNIRAPAAGEVIYVAPNLRAGGILQAGQVLVKVDPFDYELSLSDAKTALEDARSSLAEAEEQLRIQQLNVAYAQNSLELAQTDLTRANSLFDAGSLTSQQLETRELTVSQRDQSLRQAQSNIVLQEAMISRRTTAIDTAQRNIERASRALAETTIFTPYDAVVVSSNVVPGATFSQGEAVATVYQADALEVRFTLSEFQYGQLFSDGLIGREVEVVWEIEPAPIVLKGEITRIGAQVNASLGGVELFAALQSAPDTTLWPGTFVSINLPGISFENALSIPETALYADGKFYVVNERRMKSIPAQILARDGENVIVKAIVSPNDRVIITRLAQAGDGVLVNIEGEEPSGGNNGDQPRSDNAPRPPR
ncbi:MAG: HlyD family efflux transporter periplasmic adaptor subunit [Devosiaceae bacterium]|nr:HlyD family efflux transporter periplasmic adaptor subunit [Devosiaceae bacterium]